MDIGQIVVTCLAAAIVGGGGAYITFLYNRGREEQWRADTERRIEMLEVNAQKGQELREANAVRLEAMSGQMDYVLNTIGRDGKHGLRGDLHALRGDWTPVLLKIQTELERMERRR